MAAFEFAITYNPDEEVVIPESVKEKAQYLVTTLQLFLKRDDYPSYWGIMICSVKEAKKKWKMTFMGTHWAMFVQDNKIQPGDTVNFQHKHGLLNVSVYSQGLKKLLDPGEKVEHVIRDLPDAESRAQLIVNNTTPPNTYVKISQFYSNPKAAFIGISKEFGDQIMGEVRPRKDVNVKVMVGPVRYDIVLRKYINENSNQYKVVKGWKELLKGCKLRVNDALVFHCESVNPHRFQTALMFNVD